MSHVKHIVNHKRYPIDDLQSDAGFGLLETCQQQLKSCGLCLLENFIQPEVLYRMQKSAVKLLPQAHRTEHWRATPNGDSSSPDSTIAEETRASMGSIGFDSIDNDSPLREFYLSDHLTAFINALFDGPELYTTADPLISCMLTTMTAGDELGWHYDPNDIVVSLSLLSPEAGGQFEFAPRIRHPAANSVENEAAVLNGQYPDTLSKTLAPGTLSLFNGHRSLHRVSAVIGSKPRVIALFNYSEVPYYEFEHTIQRKFLGRVAS